MKTVKQFFITSIILFAALLSSATYAAEPQQKVYYFLHDHLGGINAVTDEEGNVVERRDYLPFGADRLISDASMTNYGFTGKENDPETELYYYGARYYDPFTGRFISPDPLLNALDTMNQEQLNAFLSDPQNLNTYTYSRNNPVRFIDPTGEYEEDVHYDLTFFLSQVAGLSYDQSRLIAFFDQNMDESYKTLPFSWSDLPATIVNAITGVTKDSHFATREDAISKLKNAIENFSSVAFGQALHTFQDTFSHEGYDTNHLKDRHKPDKTYNNLPKANAMAKASLKFLRSFNAVYNGRGDLTQEQYDEETEKIWIKSQNMINEYNSLEDKTGTLIYKGAQNAKNDKREQLKAK